MPLILASQLGLVIMTQSFIEDFPFLYRTTFCQCAKNHKTCGSSQPRLLCILSLFLLREKDSE